ncbi:hypothetical protein KFL_008690020 [Klebsormidium nitens]|uniref:RRM domain-containing protein n=1 Tax=Klebsormidium nitens TaxID=105231 RepID=A0A1Y1IRI4_KLENI|nr:hypothetical protein KFL_008690020 [Klebsormidium nitens]|eukprot:GAQ91851.1 hypothetical protein KFL_008690020 [Klebsormidium nitens]
MVSKKSTKKRSPAVLVEPPPEKKPAKAAKPRGTQAEGPAAGPAAAEAPSTSGRETAGAAFMPLDVEADIEVARVAARARKKGSKAAAAAGRPGVGAQLAGAGGGAQGRVVYIGRIPHGFYEDQMSGFFGQFGTISRLKVSRNKKTGKSKHYAFIEFESSEVAAIVAECMHNYLLFGSVLQCSVMDPDKLHPDTFKNANRKFVKVPWQRIAREQHNKERTPEEQQRVVTRLLKADETRRKRLREQGIEYDFEGFQATLPTKGKKTKLE